MIDSLEADAEAMAQIARHHGYGFGDSKLGRVRVLHIRETGRKRYYLNNLETSRRVVKQALDSE